MKASRNRGGRLLWWSGANVRTGWFIRAIDSYFISIPTKSFGEFFADLDRAIPAPLATATEFEHVRLDELVVIRIKWDGSRTRERIHPWRLIDPVNAWVRMPYCAEDVTVVIERPGNSEWKMSARNAERAPDCPKPPKQWHFWE